MTDEEIIESMKKPGTIMHYKAKPDYWRINFFKAVEEIYEESPDFAPALLSVVIRVHKKFLDEQ